MRHTRAGSDDSFHSLDESVIKVFERARPPARICRSEAHGSHANAVFSFTRWSNLNSAPFHR